MEIKKISTETNSNKIFTQRPDSFDLFVGQESIKGVLATAIDSAKKRGGELGHILFSGPSGFGKTTMASIISRELWSDIKIVTGYALSKPSELISVLNTLEAGDLLFIDEIHRLKPTLEEILYIAMEDFLVDMVMPEGTNVRIPINPFTLVGATTKPETMSQPMKNRFVYQFHFMDYTDTEKARILQHYLDLYEVGYDFSLLSNFVQKNSWVPREIHNFVIKLRDFVVSKKISKLDQHSWLDFLEHVQIDDGGMTLLHKKYLQILSDFNRPVGLKTLAVQLGIHEQALEEDIEPLLLKLWKIEKTQQGRILI